MALSPGSKLGPYEIQSSLGAGGMGEVYRARDTRLERIVALKVLPANFSEDAERLRRFEDEARILSTLSHPNVLAIFDVGEQDGISLPGFGVPRRTNAAGEIIRRAALTCQCHCNLRLECTMRVSFIFLAARPSGNLVCLGYVGLKLAPGFLGLLIELLKNGFLSCTGPGIG
jgi:serine/threonine protein kinase